MILDQNLIFSNFIAITSSSGSTSIDLLGGVAENIGVGTRYGNDMGIGDGVAKPKVAAFLGAALTATDASTLTINFQGSTDNSNWITYVSTGPMAQAILTAGAKVAMFDWPHRMTGAALPRYVRLQYVPSLSNFSTGTIFAGIVLQRDDWALNQYPAGFAVGA